METETKIMSRGQRDKEQVRDKDRLKKRCTDIRNENQRRYQIKSEDKGGRGKDEGEREEKES